MYIVKEGKNYKVYNFSCKMLFSSSTLQECEKYILAVGENLL